MTLRLMLAAAVGAGTSSRDVSGPPICPRPTVPQNQEIAYCDYKQVRCTVHELVRVRADSVRAQSTGMQAAVRAFKQTVGDVGAGRGDVGDICAGKQHLRTPSILKLKKSHSPLSLFCIAKPKGVRCGPAIHSVRSHKCWCADAPCLRRW